MGIRMTQIIGLSEVARKMIQGTPVLLYLKFETREYPDGRVENLPSDVVYGSNVQREVSGQLYPGMFSDENYALMKYKFPDGTILTEAVQAIQWSSGPCIFLALKDANGEWVKESLWAQEQIDSA